MYKGIKFERSSGKMCNFTLDISSNIKSKLDQYISSSQ